MSEVQLETLEQKASYGIGRQMGDQLAQQPFEGMNVSAISAGIADALDGAEMRVEVKEIQEAFNVLNERIRAQQEEEAKKASAVGEEFLAENAKRDGVVVLESGLQYEIIEAGEEGSDKPTKESKVRTHYHGTFIDGKVFDSSYDRGQPAEFPVTGVIAGWVEALQMMPVGSKWKLFIPYQLAYGERGAGGAIGPYAALVFEVELLAIV